MSETRSFSAEIWVSDRQAFQFRCHDPCRGDMWTFCLSISALHGLHPDQVDPPATLFNIFRSAIYSAAFKRMALADPTVQHELSAADVHEALELLEDRARNDLLEAKRLYRG